MHFSLIDVKISESIINQEPHCMIINSLEEFHKLSIVPINDMIDKSFFETNSLISVLYFDGSVPKRTIKNVSLVGNDIVVSTNKEDITFSTMDYRAHYFLIKILKTNLANCLLK